MVALSASSMALANSCVPVGNSLDFFSVADGSESQTGCLSTATGRAVLGGSFIRVAAKSSALTDIASRLDLRGKNEILRGGTLPGMRHRVLKHPPPCSRA